MIRGLLALLVATVYVVASLFASLAGWASVKVDRWLEERDL